MNDTPTGLPITVAPSRTSVALALGGGAARGLAHVLMLEALDELGVKPTAIAGTSIGAIVGASYASGMSGAEIRAHFERIFDKKTTPFKHLRERAPVLGWNLWNPFSGSFLNGEFLFEAMFPDRVARNFEDLKIPLMVVTTDFYEQAQVVLTKGPLMPAVAASSCLPGMMKPVRVGDRVLVDGGFVNPTPFDLVRDKAAITVAVDVTGETIRRPNGALPSMLETWIGVTQITFQSIVREKLKSGAPDILIRPRVGNFNTMDFYKFRDIFAAAEPAKYDLKRQLEQRLAMAAHVDNEW